MELIMDARCNNTQVLSDQRLLSLWMLRLCRVIKMTPVDEPVVKLFPPPASSKITGWGLSGVQFLAESSIVVHTYPEHSYIYLNLFSCKEFSAKAAIEFIVKTLGVTVKTSYLFKRGVDMETGTPLRLTPTLPKEVFG